MVRSDIGAQFSLVRSYVHHRFDMVRSDIGARLGMVKVHIMVVAVQQWPLNLHIGLAVMHCLANGRCHRGEDSPSSESGRSLVAPHVTPLGMGWSGLSLARAPMRCSPKVVKSLPIQRQFV